MKQLDLMSYFHTKPYEEHDMNCAYSLSMHAIMLGELVGRHANMLGEYVCG